MRWKRFKRFVKKVGHAVEKVAKAPIETVKNVADAATGKKKIGDALKDVLRIPLQTYASEADAIADGDRLTHELATKLVGKIGGEAAEDVMEDLIYLNKFVADPALGATLIKSADKFVETGDLEYLNPINIYAAREIENVRELMWEKAHEVPAKVLNALHPDIRKYAADVRWILESEIPGSISLPHFAINHGTAGAITLIDLIVFEAVPGHEGDKDLHLWAHELFHVHQYRSMGLESFAKNYLGESMGFRTGPTNSMEVAADLFACKYYPNGYANYLPGGVCPI